MQSGPSNRIEGGRGEGGKEGRGEEGEEGRGAGDRDALYFTYLLTMRHCTTHTTTTLHTHTLHHTTHTIYTTTTHTLPTLLHTLHTHTTLLPLSEVSEVRPGGGAGEGAGGKNAGDRG